MNKGSDAGLREAARQARDFLWAKSNAPEYRNLANRLTRALAKVEDTE